MNDDEIPEAVEGLGFNGGYYIRDEDGEPRSQRDGIAALAQQWFFGGHPDQRKVLREEWPELLEAIVGIVIHEVRAG